MTGKRASCAQYKNKRDKLICHNYRVISLLCVAYRIFTSILKNRLEFYSEKIVGRYQAGFRTGKSTVDQLFTVKNILEIFSEFNMDVLQIFIHFRQAYDNIKDINYRR
jgi:hypothetical protein